MGGLALLLIMLSDRVPQLAALRSQLSVLATPIYRIAEIPSRATRNISAYFTSHDQLLAENEQLRAEAIILNAKVQKLASLRAENVRLRGLLNSSSLVEQQVVVAEVIGVSPDPAHHEIVLSMGWDEGVYLGQPLIDASGMAGQIIEVGPLHSRALLITDVAHALSVQVNRNGVRAIAEGTGRLDLLELAHVPATADIQAGDLLVSSGLEGRFPRGYPVAEVKTVTVDPGQPFANVEARPLAQLDRMRHVLLVFTEKTVGD